MMTENKTGPLKELPNLFVFIDSDSRISKTNEKDTPIGKLISKNTGNKLSSIDELKALATEIRKNKKKKLIPNILLGNYGRFDIYLHHRKDSSVLEFVDQEEKFDMMRKQRTKYIIDRFTRSGEITIVLDNEGKIVDYNELIKKYTSQPKKRIIGKSLPDLMFPKYKELAKKRIKQAASGITSGPDTVKVKTSKGVFYFEGVFSPLFSSVKKNKLLYIVIKDITEKQEYQEKINQTKILNESIINGINYGIAVIDSQSKKIKLVNNWWSKRLKATKEELIGVKCDILFNGDNCKICKHNLNCPVDETLKTGLSSNKSFTTTVNNKKHYFLNSSYPLLGENKKIEQIIIITKDITRRKTMEKDLDNKIKKLSAIYDISKTVNLRTNLEAILNLVILKIVSLAKINFCLIMMLDNSQQKLIPRSFYNLEEKDIEPYEVNINKLPLAKKAIASGKSVYIDEIRTKEYGNYFGFVRKNKIKSFVCLPLKFEDQVFGVINLYFTKKKEFTKDDKDLLDSLSYQTSIVLENHRLYTQSRLMNKQILNLYSTSTILQATMDVDRILDIGLKTFSNLGFDRIRMYMFDKDNNILKGAKSTHMGYDKISSIILDTKKNKNEFKAIKERRPILTKINQRNQAKYSNIDSTGVKEIVFLPLLSKETPIGLISLDNKYSQRIIQEHELVSMMSFTNQIAIAIENATLYNEVISKNKQLWSLYNSSSVLQETMDARKVADIVIDNLKKQGYERIRIYLYNENEDMFYGYKSNHVPKEIFGKIKIDMKSHPEKAGDLFRKKAPIVFKPKKTKYSNLLEKEDISESASLPLISKSKTIGFISIDNKYSGRPINEKELMPLMTFSNQVAVAIENSRLYQKIKDFNETLQDEIYRATRELEEKNKRLMELDKLKSEFVNVVSHELRTPLTSIKGYSSLLLGNKITNEEMKTKSLKIIKDESDRLTYLLNDILDLSKLESGKFNLKHSMIDISSTIKQVIDTQEFLMDEKNIKINLDMDDNIQEIEIDGDKIKQVLFNLINNSIKYSDENSEILISTKDCGDKIIVTIKDNGRGIPQEEIPKLFDKFYQVENHMVRTEKGTGLGLAIVKEILQKHGSQVRIISEVGKGTEFSFSLNKTKKPGQVKEYGIFSCWSENESPKDMENAKKSKCWLFLNNKDEKKLFEDKKEYQNCQLYKKE